MCYFSLVKGNYSSRLKSPSLGTSCQPSPRRARPEGVSASADTLHVCIAKEVGEGRLLAAGPKRVTSSHRLNSYDEGISRNMLMPAVAWSLYQSSASLSNARLGAGPPGRGNPCGCPISIKIMVKAYGATIGRGRACPCPRGATTRGATTRVAPTTLMAKTSPVPTAPDRNLLAIFGKPWNHAPKLDR